MNELEQQFIRKVTILEPLKDIQILFDNNFMVVTCFYKFNYNEELTKEITYHFFSDDLWEYCENNLENEKIETFLNEQLERLQNEENKPEIPEDKRANIINSLINNQ